MNGLLGLIATLFYVQEYYTRAVLGTCFICNKPIYVGDTCVCEHGQYFCTIACANQYLTQDEFFIELVTLDNGALNIPCAICGQETSTDEAWASPQGYVCPECDDRLTAH